MITRDQYETFRNNINALIQEYREKFSMPLITDSKKYEETYRKRLLGMSRELKSMIDHVSFIVADEFGRPSLLDAKEKAFIILVKEIMKLSNRRMAYELPLLGITGRYLTRLLSGCIRTYCDHDTKQDLH